MTSNTPGPWARLYKTRRWERRSRLNLKLHKYLCQDCLKAGKTEPAILSHHVNEYRESFSEMEFWYGPLTALCKNCHAAHHGYNQSRGFEVDIGSDGFPLDVNHPFWKASLAQEERDLDE
jgi:5-methylcytosine-specific restriction endonuclease McrA